MANDPARNAAYTAAARRIREAHPDEWHEYLKEETESRGLEYKPRLSGEEAAWRQIGQLMLDFPALKDRLTGG
jgi:hypothetical protein